VHVVGNGEESCIGRKSRKVTQTVSYHSKHGGGVWKNELSRKEEKGGLKAAFTDEANRQVGIGEHLQDEDREREAVSAVLERQKNLAERVVSRRRSESNCESRK